MYEWRTLNLQERKEILDQRKRNGLAWHTPPHLDLEGERKYFVTAACFEHIPVIGISRERMIECEKQILSISQNNSTGIFAWCVLPNHYLILLQTESIKELRRQLGLFHGRSSRSWNLEDDQIGRQVWHNCFERPLKSDRHFQVTMNYIHHNPVYHGYVNKWTDWLFSSARDFLEQVGSEKAKELWQNYPILDYGKKWDI